MHSMKILFLLSAFILVGTVEAADQPATSDDSSFEQTWQVVTIQGQRVGYAHSSSREREVDGQTIVESDTLTKMSIARFGQKLEIRQQMHMEESADGNLLRFTSIMENPPNSRISSTGVLNGDEMSLTTLAGGKQTEKTLTGMDGIVSPSWAENYLTEHGLEIGGQIQFDTFEPQMAKRTTVTFRRQPDKTTSLWGGETRKLTYITMTYSVLPGVVTEMFLDENLDLHKISMPLLGMEIHTVSEEEALQEPDGGDLDFAKDMLVRVERMDSPHQASEVTYRIQVDGSNPAELFESGATQALRPVDEDEIDLTVRTLRPSTTLAERTPAVGNEFLQASRFLECDQPALQRLAEQGDADATAPSEIAVALERFVREYVNEKNFSTSMATALEVAQSRSGDCSEHAVLLAALLRVKEIPSRVVVGLVYSKSHSAFIGHMWTEAFLAGNWIPLDATLAQGGIGAGHIKVASSSLAEEAPIPAAEFVPLIHLLGRTTISVVTQR